MDNQQMERILKSCNFKYPQQQSNMKKKINDKNFKSILQRALYQEIEYLNNELQKKK